MGRAPPGPTLSGRARCLPPFNFGALPRRALRLPWGAASHTVTRFDGLRSPGRGDVNARRRGPDSAAPGEGPRGGGFTTLGVGESAPPAAPAGFASSRSSFSRFWRVASSTGAPALPTSKVSMGRAPALYVGSLPSHRSSARYCRTDGVIERRMISLACAVARALMSTASASPCAFCRAASAAPCACVMACVASASTCATRLRLWMAFCVASMARLMASDTFCGRRSVPLMVSWSMTMPSLPKTSRHFCVTSASILLLPAP